jgi:hypothetical protein
MTFKLSRLAPDDVSHEVVRHAPQSEDVKACVSWCEGGKVCVSRCVYVLAVHTHTHHAEQTKLLSIKNI